MTAHITCLPPELLQEILCDLPNADIKSFRGDSDIIWNGLEYDGAEEDREYQWIPLQTIFPIQLWSNLRHFCLSRFIVKQHDVMSLLHALPLTLESIELSFLTFFPEDGSYRGLLEDMRSKLGWRERQAEKRPRIIIYGDEESSPDQEQPIDVSREVEGFVYGHGESPFPEDGELFSEIGTTIDVFDPHFERPNVNALKLMELGIMDKSHWVIFSAQLGHRSPFPGF